MKKYLAIGLLVSFLLMGCSNQNEVLFKQKQECAKYYTEELKKEYAKEVFYSPSKNTCITYKDYGYFATIEDTLTKEELFRLSNSNYNIEERKEFADKIKELKWE